MVDIVSTDQHICPSDYETIISNEWAGTKEGCHCGSVVYIGSCMEAGKDSDKNCEDVQGIGSIKYETWNNKRICVKREKKLYFDLNLYQDVCPTNFPKKCGVIDSMGIYSVSWLPRSAL